MCVCVCVSVWARVWMAEVQSSWHLRGWKKTSNKQAAGNRLRQDFEELSPWNVQERAKEVERCCRQTLKKKEKQLKCSCHGTGCIWCVWVRGDTERDRESDGEWERGRFGIGVIPFLSSVQFSSALYAAAWFTGKLMRCIWIWEVKWAEPRPPVAWWHSCSRAALELLFFVSVR